MMTDKQKYHYLTSTCPQTRVEHELPETCIIHYIKERKHFLAIILMSRGFISQITL